MTQHWGTDINPAFFVEVPDPANAGQTKRPTDPVVVQVQSAPALTPLPSFTTGTYGYWTYSLEDDSVNAINVSSDGGVTWVGPLYSRESSEGAANSGTAAAQALSVANQASTTVGTFNARLGTLEAGGGGGGGSSTVAGITDAGSAGKAVLLAPDAVAARAAIGAGTSSLTIGTTAGTAKGGDIQPTIDQVTGVTTTGKALAKAVDAPAARTALSLDQVNNTSDANKPVSTAQAAALAGKQKAFRDYPTAAAAAAGLAAGEFGEGDYVTAGA